MNTSKRFIVEMLIAALLFAAAVAIFFGPELLHGKSLWEYVGNDKSYYFIYYPAFAAQQRLYHDGYFPIWWSVAGVGLPMLGGWIWSVFYPNQMIWLPFKFLKIVELLLLNRLWLMGVMAYFFGRKALSLSPRGAALAGVTYAFTGYAMNRLVMGDPNVTYLIPLFAYAVGEQVPRPKWGLVVIAGLAGAVNILSGHPPQGFYSFFFGSAWWFYRWITVGRASPKGMVGILAAMVLSALISGIQLMPGLESMALMWSYHPVNPMNESYPAIGMFSLIMPWLVGVQKNNQLTVKLAEYIGLIPVIMALFGITQLKRIGRGGGFFAAVAILFTGVVYGLPIFRLWQHLPGFSRLANRISAMSSIALCVGLLAGLALDYAVRDANSRRAFFRFMLWMLPVLLIVCGYGRWLIGYFESDKALRTFLGAGAAIRHDWLMQSAVAAGLALALCVISYILHKGASARAVAGWLIVALTMFGLRSDYQGWYLQDPGAYKRIERSGGLAAIADDMSRRGVKPADRTHVRMTAPNDFIPVYLFSLRGWSDIRALAGFHPMRYFYLMNRINGRDIERTREGYEWWIKIMIKFFFVPFPVEKISSPVGNLLGVRYGVAPPGYKAVDLPVLYSGEDSTVYENPNAGPRAFVAERYRILDRAIDTLDVMINEPAGWERTALFAREDYPRSEPWKIVAATDTPVSATSEIKLYRDQVVELKVKSSEPSFVVATDLYFPGWKATVNNAPTRILRADYLLKAVPVPKGESNVRMWYQPVSFAVGLWATLSSLAFVFFIGLIRLMQTPNKS